MLNLWAVLLGSSVSFLIFFNGVLSKYTGEGNSLVIIHFIGLAVIGLIYLLKKERFRGLASVPPYFFTSGIIGVGVIFFENLAIKQIGASITIVLLMSGQLFASIIIDAFGLFGRKVYKLTLAKTISLALMLSGITVLYL